jgi:hypothetical protein
MARETGETPTTPARRASRMVEGLAFVAGWVAIGYVFDLGKTLNRQCVRRGDRRRVLPRVNSLTRRGETSRSAS